MVRLEERYGRFRFIPRFDPVEELISCILSQHSSDATSFPTFTRLMERFPDWDAMASAPPEAIIEVIRPAGLPQQKAKAIQASLRAIQERFGEITLWPLLNADPIESRKWLQSLPGIGPKTASIVLCFALGLHAIPVDTHVHRVALRLGLLAPGTNEVAAHDHLLKLVPEELAFRFHTTLIQHGRQLCRAPKPICERCPLVEDCPSAKKFRRAA